jgi:hypothetical protein
MKTLTTIRNEDAYHVNIETPLDENRFNQFRSAMKQLENWIKAFD